MLLAEQINECMNEWMNYHMTAVTGRYGPEHSVFTADKAVDTNSLHSMMQLVEILCKKLIFV